MVFNMYKFSGIGLDLACNLIVLLFRVCTLVEHWGVLACFLLRGSEMC